jgi:hypothetical protein
MVLSDDDLQLAKPLAPVAHSMDALLDTYDAARVGGEEPAEAFVDVIERVLAPDDARGLLAYLEGRDDHMLGTGAGRAASDRLLDSFERAHLEREQSRGVAYTDRSR